MSSAAPRREQLPSYSKILQIAPTSHSHCLKIRLQYLARRELAICHQAISNGEHSEMRIFTTYSILVYRDQAPRTKCILSLCLFQQNMGYSG